MNRGNFLLILKKKKKKPPVPHSNTSVAFTNQHMMHHLQSFFSIFLVAPFASSALATIISTFSDDNCKDSYKAFDGPNGYPNGTCTAFRSNGAFGSFQVTQEDSGCGVTIYGNDSIPGSPCSSNNLQLAQLATCYNASWIYFSIDECQLPASTSVVPAATASASSSTSTYTTASAAATTTTTTSSGGGGSSSTNIGAIVGGVVGGVVGLALIALAAWSLWLREQPRRAAANFPHTYNSNNSNNYNNNDDDDDDDKNIATDDFISSKNQKVQELPPQSDKVEMSSTGNSAKYELFGSSGNAELGNTQKPMYYAELPGHEP